MRPKPDEEKAERINSTVPPQMAKEVRDYASSQRRPVSSIVQEALDDYFVRVFPRLGGKKLCNLLKDSEKQISGECEDFGA